MLTRKKRMHRIWTIPELVQRILKAGRLSWNDLAHVARVSKWFWQIAAPMLWEKLEYHGGWTWGQPADLFSVLPYELQCMLGNKSIDQIRMAGLLNPLKYHRFDLHRHFVKKFELLLDDEDQSTYLNILVLSGFTHQMFPNLRDLTVVIPWTTRKTGNRLNAIISPSIQSLEFRYSVSRTDGLNSENVASAIRILQEAALSLLELTINPGCTGDAISTREWDLQSQFLLSTPSLRRLKLASLSVEALVLFAAAAQLPNLIDLEIIRPRSWKESFEETGSIGPVGFPALRRLYFATGHRSTEASHALLIGILACVTSLEVEELKFVFETTSSFTRNRNDRFDAFERFTALKIFHVEFWNEGDLRREDMIHLSKCSQLEVLYLVCEGAATLFDDQTMNLTAEAWPNLRKIHVSSRNRHRAKDEPPPDLIPPSLTLQGLANLTTHCLVIESVTIYVDTRGTPPILTSVPCFSVRHLSVRESHVDECVEDVGSFIANLWPNLLLDPGTILRDPYQRDYASKAEKELGSRWRHVWKAVATKLGQRLDYNDKISDCSAWRDEPDPPKAVEYNESNTSLKAGGSPWRRVWRAAAKKLGPNGKNHEEPGIPRP